MRRNFMKLGALMAAMSMIGAPVMAGNTGNVSGNIRTANKDAVKNEVTPVRPVMQRNAFGGYGNMSLKAAGLFKNQRQYRKHCRSNPFLYSNKKHRTKN